MWTVDRRRRSGDSEDGGAGSNEDTFDSTPTASGSLAPKPQPEEHFDFTDPFQTLTGPVSVVDPHAAEYRMWREELAAVGGPSPLIHFDDRPANRIELSTTHPGGLPQFITGQKILLSALIRDDLALRHARVAAGRVTDKSIEMRTVRGLETVHLAVGLAKWSFEGEDFCAPVLLRPLAIRRYGRDFELKLKRHPIVNPMLLITLREQFGISIDARSLLELSQSAGVFKPQPVIDRLRQMAAGIAGFVVQPRLVVSSFNDVSTRMVADVRGPDTPIISAICGSESTLERLRDNYQPVTAPPPNTRAPETDRRLYDVDAEQDDVLAQIQAGHSLVTRTLPGTGGTQTVACAIGDLVRDGKKVLVVSPRRATLDGVAHRLSRVGLAGLAVTPRLLRRNLVEAINRNEAAKPPAVHEVDSALVRLRTVLLAYQNALTTPDAKLAVSPIDALHELSKLAKYEVPPTTTVRLGEQALATLALDRSSIADALTEAARLGQFQYGPEDSPWYGVNFETTEAARAAYALAVDLAESQLPRLVSLANDLIEQTLLRPYENIAELGIYLRLLLGVTETLDKFGPDVYDRSLTEVIAAHAPRGGGDEMSKGNRRRLRKLAKEYVRPGQHVPDLYAKLLQIQQQRVLWQRYSSKVGSPPQVPQGLNDVVSAYQAAYADLDELDRALGHTHDADRLRVRPLAELARLTTELARESEVLQNIQERTAIVERMRAAHLDELLDDLSARHVPASQVAAELDQSWWQSALEHMLRTNQALLSGNTGVIERFESDFRLVDDAHAGASGGLLAAKLADAWRLAVLDHRGEAVALRELLRGGGASLASLVDQAPSLLGTLAPVWALSPYEVPQIPEGMRFDTVLLLDAGAMSLAESLGAIRRADQVVAFGDTVTQTPSPFEIAVRLNDDDSDHGAEFDAEAWHSRSAYAQLREVLPELSLTQSYRAGGEDLTTLINTRFYDGDIESMPWAGSYLGHSSIALDFVRGGQGLPDPHSGAVESTDAEVERVVQLVLEHASTRPNESLMVITASERHAVRVYQAVLHTFAKFPEYRDFLLGDRAEPFAVLTLEQATAQSRDRVIFSIGYGRTPHGRVLSNFGSLSKPGGERLIAVAMTRARRAMTIVSCFKPADLDTARLKHGSVELAELLSLDQPMPQPEALPAEIHPMLGELADRLTRLGVRVTLDYRGMIPLAAAYGDRVIAVDVDFGGSESSLRDALRLRPSLLRRLGWHYCRVHSFDLFADPSRVTQQIAQILGLETSDEAAETAAVSGVASGEAQPAQV